MYFCVILRDFTDFHGVLIFSEIIGGGRRVDHRAGFAGSCTSGRGMGSCNVRLGNEHFAFGQGSRALTVE